MMTFTEIDAARSANRDEFGQIKNQSLDRRLIAQERLYALEALGWKPEQANDPYAATTGELRQWAIEELSL